MKARVIFAAEEHNEDSSEFCVLRCASKGRDVRYFKQGFVSQSAHMLKRSVWKSGKKLVCYLHRSNFYTPCQSPKSITLPTHPRTVYTQSCSIIYISTTNTKKIRAGWSYRMPPPNAAAPAPMAPSRDASFGYFSWTCKAIISKQF